MKPITPLTKCLSPSRARSSAREAKGIVLIVVMMISVLLLIALTAALPSFYQEGQREKEDELIFRGTQYARAVALFHKQFNRYPVSIKELMETNGMHFLRKEYTDPMDKKGKWRYIHTNAVGVLIDSKNQPLMPLGNANGPQGMGGQSGFGGQNSPPGGSPFGPQSGFGGTSSPGSAIANPAQSPVAERPSAVAGGNSTSSSSFFGNNEVRGAFIVGVAATSSHDSIKVWNKKKKYDEWEFVGLDMGVFGIQVGVPGVSPGIGPNSSPGLQNPFGPQGQNPSSFGSQGQSPSSFGPQGQNPSSFGPQSQNP